MITVLSPNLHPKGVRVWGRFLLLFFCCLIALVCRRKQSCLLLLRVFFSQLFFLLIRKVTSAAPLAVSQAMKDAFFCCRFLSHSWRRDDAGS
ncbi:hypothetical protein T492DRAFT_1004025, partial [Pavlovales sp. CCMP2436]